MSDLSSERVAPPQSPSLPSQPGFTSTMIAAPSTSLVPPLIKMDTAAPYHASSPSMDTVAIYPVSEKTVIKTQFALVDDEQKIKTESARIVILPPTNWQSKYCNT